MSNSKRSLFIAMGLISVSTGVVSKSFASSGASPTPATAPTTAKVCAVTDIEDERVRGRAKAITFPDGRVVTVVGHAHGHRQIYDLAKTFGTDGQSSKAKDPDVQTLLLAIEKENAVLESTGTTRSERESMNAEFRKSDIGGVDILDVSLGLDLPPLDILTHARQDYSYLEDQLRSQNPPKFVGWEGAPDQRNRHLSAADRTVVEVTKSADRARRQGKLKLSEARVQDILLSATNGHVFLYTKKPQLFSNAPVVGTEDPVVVGLITQAESRRGDVLVKLRSEIAAIIERTDAYLETLSPARRERILKDKKALVSLMKLRGLQSDLVTMTVPSVEALRKRMDALVADAPSFLKEDFIKLLPLMEERILENSLRDLGSAKNLAAQKTSGIHFVGMNHLRSTMRFLDEICEAELNPVSQQTAAGPSQTGRAPVDASAYPAQTSAYQTGPRYDAPPQVPPEQGARVEVPTHSE